MIQSIKLKNFRNFQDEEFYFCDKTNIIVGNNGKGKTNILEALSLFSKTSLVDLSFDSLTLRGNDVMYIEVKTTTNDILSISFDKTIGKKKYILNGKNTSKKKLRENYPSIVLFDPMSMNVMYLSPSLRRGFIDEILSNCFSDYSRILKNYKNMLKSRNRILKNIGEGKSQKVELNFWDEKFISEALGVYAYRKKLIDFLEENINELQDIFGEKVKEIKFNYITKIPLSNIEGYIKEYLEKNRDRDIIIGKTMIGPHRDDFNILVDNIPLIEFASRGEVKSIILGMKFLEARFIENTTGKIPVFLIDDILSELDEIHKNYVIEMSGNRQVIITSIEMIESIDNKIKL